MGGARSGTWSRRAPGIAIECGGPTIAIAVTRRYGISLARDSLPNLGGPGGSIPTACPCSETRY